MYDFILQVILFASATLMAFLAARALPRVMPAENPKSVWSHIDEWFGRLPLHRLDDRVNSFLFKFLKRSRVVMMKIDNRLTRHLHAVKSRGDSRATGHVQEMLDHVQGDNSDIESS